MNIYYVAFVWMAMALAASLISIRVGVSVALIEILVGAVVGNLPDASNWVHQTEFTTFLASIGSIMLTFLAGAEIDPVSLRRHWKASLSIGFVSFLVPFLGALAFCYFPLGWSLHAAEIGGVALSTTSVAVVYAVMVETGLNRQELGKLILAACFVTDLGTVLMLGGLFASFGGLLIVFAAVSAAVLAMMPATTRFLIDRVGHRVSEPEIKFLLVILFGSGPSRRARAARRSCRRISPGSWSRASSCTIGSSSTACARSRSPCSPHSSSCARPAHLRARVAVRSGRDRAPVGREAHREGDRRVADGAGVRRSRS